jgi:hypothetical protein
VSNPYQPQDPYQKDPYGEQPPQTPPPGAYGYPQQPPPPPPPGSYPQDPYAQQPPPPGGYGYPPPPPQQPGGYQQPGYGGYNGLTGESNGIATAAMVVGIVSLVTLCFFGWFLGIASIGLGVGGLGRSKTTGTGRGQAIAGIVTGGVAILLGIIFMVLIAANGDFNTTY